MACGQPTHRIARSWSAPGPRPPRGPRSTNRGAGLFFVAFVLWEPGGRRPGAFGGARTADRGARYAFACLGFGRTRSAADVAVPARSARPVNSRLWTSWGQIVT